MTAARTFLSEWTLRLPLLSGNPGSSGKFSVLFFSVAEDYLFPLSGVSWKEAFILCFTKLLVDRFISQVMACVMELFINFPEFILYRFQVLSGSCKSYCFNVEILICGDYAVAAPSKMPSNRILPYGNFIIRTVGKYGKFRYVSVHRQCLLFLSFDTPGGVSVSIWF